MRLRKRLGTRASFPRSQTALADKGWRGLVTPLIEPPDKNDTCEIVAFREDTGANKNPPRRITLPLVGTFSTSPVTLGKQGKVRRMHWDAPNSWANTPSHDAHLVALARMRARPQCRYCKLYARARRCV